jgi:nucleoside-diphosphate-sugar epimerase
MSKYVISGGAGFIGSNIAHRLVKEGHNVVVVDNLINGDLDNLTDIMANIKFLEFDLRDPLACKSVCENADYVIHQAALGSVPRSVEDPVLTNDHNVTATLRLLVAAKAAGVRRFVYASSSGVYGDQDVDLKHERLPTMPINPYAVSKLAAEEYVKTFHRVYGMPTVALRYFNVFGPRQRPDGPYAAVIPKFIANAIAGKPSVIYGDGDQARDFTFVEDVVDVNLEACRSREEHVVGEVFNVGGGINITINQVYRMIYRFAECDAKPVYEPPRKGDIKYSKANISKTMQRMLYFPYGERKFDRCLKETLDWYRNRANG